MQKLDLKQVNIYNFSKFTFVISPEYVERIRNIFFYYFTNRKYKNDWKYRKQAKPCFSANIETYGKT